MRVFYLRLHLYSETQNDGIFLSRSVGLDAEATPHSSESDRSLADLLSESSLFAGRTRGRQGRSRGSLVSRPPLAPCLLRLTFNTCGAHARATSLTLPPRDRGSRVILGSSDQGSHYEDHVTHISPAQAGGLLS